MDEELIKLIQITANFLKIGDIGNEIIENTIKILLSYQHRKQREKLEEMSCAAAARMEQNRKDFVLSLYQSYAEQQNELAVRSHRDRLEEQEALFRELKSAIEYKYFLESWPLLCLPDVIRHAQTASLDRTALQVIYAPSDDPFFTKNIYPKLQYELRNFTDRYRNQFHSSDLIFYHNGYKPGSTGGAVNLNIRHALNALPVVILETTILFDEIEIYLTMWGLGCTDSFQTSVCRFPYHPQSGQTTLNALTDALLAVMKSLIGYSCDAYRLLEFGEMPLFADIARCEQKNNIPGAILNYAPAPSLLGQLYTALYDQALGSSADPRTPSVTRQSVLHRLRLGYARHAKFWLDEETCLRILRESLTAWCFLRTESSPEEFLNTLYSNGFFLIDKYFSEDDKRYFKELSEAYAALSHPEPAIEHLTAWFFASPDEKTRAAGKWRHRAEEELSLNAPRADLVLEYYRNAAGFGDAEAALITGFLYHYGIGTEPDIAAARCWYAFSAERGSKDAAINETYCRQQGFSANTLEESKTLWYDILAAIGNADFNYRLGKSFRPQFHKLFHDWYKEKADRGDADAQYAIGCCYENDIYHIPAKKYVKWTEKVYDIEEIYDPYDDTCLLLDRKTGRTYQPGVSKSVFSFDIVEKQEWVDIPLAEQAFVYFQSAAIKGLPPAAEKLIACYATGFGCPADPIRAEHMRQLFPLTHSIF